jgi:hypothetical protein
MGTSMGTVNHRLPNPMGSGMGTILHPQVAPVPNPNLDGYEAGIFICPRVSRQVPEFSSHKISTQLTL